MSEFTITNDAVTLSVSTKASEIHAFHKNGGREWMWQGDPQFWSGRNPTLFPLVGSTYDKKLHIDGKTYAIGNHGFARERCDIVVCEVGMGGEFDATNVIPSPEAAVLTNIGLDHTAVLGDTLEQIAATKSGIIKPGCHAVLYPCAPSVREVVAARCRAAGAPLTVVDFGAIQSVSDSLDGQVFHFGAYRSLHLPLLGAHQLRNAAVALTAVEVLRQRGLPAAVRRYTVLQRLRRADLFLLKL